MANNRKVVTVASEGIFLAFPHLFEPYAVSEDQEPKYSTMVVIPKTATKTIAKIKAAQDAAKAEQTNKFGGKIPKNLRTTIHDGDNEEETDLGDKPWLAGCYYLNVSSKRRPGVVDQGVNPILDASEVYSGVIARVSMTAYCYNVSGNKGVTFGLENVQKVRDGEAIGSGPSRAEDDFDALDDEEDEGGLL